VTQYSNVTISFSNVAWLITECVNRIAQKKKKSRRGQRHNVILLRKVSGDDTFVRFGSN